MSEQWLKQQALPFEAMLLGSQMMNNGIQEEAVMPDSRVIATVIRIQAMPTIVTERLMSSLAQQGVDGSVVTTGSCFELQVPGGAEPLSLGRRVSAALDSLVLTEGRSLVPEQIGPTSFVLRPAAG
jgi:hypothetical protein